MYIYIYILFIARIFNIHGSGVLTVLFGCCMLLVWLLQCTLWGLAVCCFLEREAWSLTPFCLLAILDSAFPSFWQECLVETPESAWLTLALLGLLERCQLAYLQYWVLCLTNPRLAPSQSASLCVFHGFMEWVVGIFDGAKYALKCLTHYQYWAKMN